MSSQFLRNILLLHSCSLTESHRWLRAATGLCVGHSDESHKSAAVCKPVFALQSAFLPWCSAMEQLLVPRYNHRGRKNEIVFYVCQAPVMSVRGHIGHEQCMSVYGWCLCLLFWCWVYWVYYKAQTLLLHNGKCSSEQLCGEKKQNRKPTTNKNLPACFLLFRCDVCFCLAQRQHFLPFITLSAHRQPLAFSFGQDNGGSTQYISGRRQKLRALVRGKLYHSHVLLGYCLSSGVKNTLMYPDSVQNCQIVLRDRQDVSAAGGSRWLLLLQLNNISASSAGSLIIAYRAGLQQRSNVSPDRSGECRIIVRNCVIDDKDGLT